MKILLASSEVHPFSKTGGLADMVGALAKALASAGHQVAVAAPYYRETKAVVGESGQAGQSFDLQLGPARVLGRFIHLRTSPGVEWFFLDHPSFFDRPGVYQERGVVYPDNELRFLFLSKAVVHLLTSGTVAADVVHVHDWQVAMVPLLLRHSSTIKGQGGGAPTCLTIHNLAYQGVFPPGVFELTNLPWHFFSHEGVEFYGQFNFLKAGIVYSDAITTVSPRYAREILTGEFGCALDGVLRARQMDLAGILNGVDYGEWRTEANPHLRHQYSRRNLSGKIACKKDLQKELGLEIAPGVPLFVSVTRLAEQKGIDLTLGALEEMLSTNMQFAILGSGSPEFEAAFKSIASRFPDRCAVRIGYDNALAHRMEAGGDYFLMPSRFEPCGLNQMYSLRYGTIPIVRATGGLDDSVIDATESAADANGIKFYEYAPGALVHAMRKALVLYGDPKAVEHYRLNGMRADFSWERAVCEYERVYEKLVKAGGTSS